MQRYIEGGDGRRLEWEEVVEAVTPHIRENREQVLAHLRTLRGERTRYTITEVCDALDGNVPGRPVAAHRPEVVADPPAPMIGPAMPSGGMLPPAPIVEHEAPAPMIGPAMPPGGVLPRAPALKDYVNLNRDADEDELRVGVALDRLAQRGQLPGADRVVGYPELRGRRSGDYRFYNRDEERLTSADLLSVRPDRSIQNVVSDVQKKWDQAHVVVLRRRDLADPDRQAREYSEVAAWFESVIRELGQNPAMVRPGRVLLVDANGQPLANHDFADRDQQGVAPGERASEIADRM